MATGSNSRCARCHATSAWNELPVVDLIDAERLRTIVTSWPVDDPIEVRRCRSCGGTIARRRRCSGPGA
jgi:hypothetical protein